MSFKHLRLLNLLRLFHRKGFRGGMNSIATALARKHLSVPVNVIGDYQMVFTKECAAALQGPGSGPLRVNWLLSGIAGAHGGLFNVFRTIQQLEAWGHENRVYVTGTLEGGPALAKERIRKSYFAIDAEVAMLSDGIEDSDALIATSWPTAYAARAIGNTGKKFYFVQDLEHMFYAPGSLFEFARQTYGFGFHGITAGSWIADVLRREFRMSCSVYGFSYDREVYSSTGNRLLPSGKKRVLFYARPETERRGFELGILALSLVAKKLPDTEFVLVGFPRRSLDLPFQAIFPGVLPLSELGALYRSCDVALVLSHTNLSLLPLELMACGCAVVSNQGPNTEWLLTNETVRLAGADPSSLADGLIELLESDMVRLQKIEAGLAFVKATHWTQEIRAIESALLENRENPLQSVPHV
jgi:glycosyltransferase involved in cell wall biosynthesis